MQDIINSFKAHLYDRTSSPIIGSFIFYWLICNYKMVVVLFDKTLNSDEKFKAIDLLYQDDIISIFSLFDVSITGVILPIVITLVYVLVFPFISNLIYQGWIYHQNKLKEISNSKLLTKKEFGDLQQKFVELELSFDDKFNKKDTEILQLKSFIEKKDKLIFEYQNKIETLESKIVQDKEDYQRLHNDYMNLDNNLNKTKGESSELRNKIKELENILEKKNPLDLDEKEIQILQFIGEHDGVNDTSIKSSLKIHQVKIENACEKLKMGDYIRKGYNKTSQRESYTILDKGKFFLLNNKYI